MKWAMLLGIVGVVAVPCQQSRATDSVEVAPGISVEKHTYGVPSNEAPFFNFAAPTPEQRVANEDLLKAVAAVEPDRVKAASRAVNAGWEALLGRRDPATAGKRFNQAFLLAPDQSGIYHGFGVLVATRFNDVAFADELLTLAERMNSVPKNLAADHGRMLLTAGRPKDAIPYLRRAIEADPDWAVPRSNLAVATLQTGERAQACELTRSVGGRDADAVANDVAYVRQIGGC